MSGVHGGRVTASPSGTGKSWWKLAAVEAWLDPYPKARATAWQAG